jgi:hypothetical protein
VALTLPEDVIEALGRLDDDLGRAVVRLSQPLVANGSTHAAVELSKYHGNAVIVVKPIKGLERIPGVTLVPLPDGRALISLHESMSISEFEVKLLDTLDNSTTAEPSERSVMLSIAETLRSARQTAGITVQQRSIIVLRSNARRRVADGPQPRTRAPRNRGRRDSDR